MEDREVTLTLKLSEVNLVLEGVGELPANRVLPILGKIKQQADAQIAEEAESDGG